MNYVIRPIKKSEISLLEEFLYQAIFIPKGGKKPPREIIKLPELQIYVSEFGRKKDDIAFVAEVNGKLIGAVWTRIMKDFGYVDDFTPSLSISVCNGYRNKGIGTKMMKVMLQHLKSKGYKQTSLSVQKSNYASKMYKKLGYEVIKENEEDYVMIYNLQIEKEVM
ncbi:MAG: GNAT family N-acetyltransferase [Clostridiales bacterium]|nr:MAG: GNAT family N-acetyltransferase [Clostridiales bacterium]